jgi:hypothetical protein
MARPTHWRTLEELADAAPVVSLIFEPVDYEVDFVVEETAEDRRKGLRVLRGGKDAS